MGLSYGTCQRILSDELNMRQTIAKFVPRNNIGQKSAWNIRSRSQQTQTCFPRLQLVTKVGLMGTILKQNSNRPSGSVHLHPG